MNTRTMHEKAFSYSVNTTNLLILVWCGLCVTLAVLDGHMWIVFGSSALFTLLRLTIIPHCSVRWIAAFPAMTPIDQQLWLNTAVSFTHSTMVSGLVGWSLWTETPSNYVTDASLLSIFILGVSTGYFAYDLWDMMVSSLYVKAPSILIHHVVVLVCYVSAIYKQIGIPYLVLALICEWNSVFLHLRKLCAMNGYTWNSAVYQWIWTGLWSTFFATRVGVHLMINYMVYQDKQQFPHVIFFAMAFGGMMLFNGLNSQLCWGVYKSYKKDKACRKSI